MVLMGAYLEDGVFGLFEEVEEGWAGDEVMATYFVDGDLALFAVGGYR